MPRKGGGRPPPRPIQRSKSAPSLSPHQQHAPPPAVAAPARGGLFGSIAEGMAFGTGSAIAHRAVDAIVGPRVVQHEHSNSNAPAAHSPASVPTQTRDDTCINPTKAFQECLNANVDDIGKCQIYLEMLKECRKNATTSDATPS